MSDYIADAIAACDISIENELISEQRYRSCLTSSRSSMTREIQMKEGSDAGPTAGQMLYYFLSKIQAVDATSDFLEWADETGSDASDGSVLEDYKSLVKDSDDLKALVGSDVYSQLLQSLSIDQAISRAAAGLRR